MATILELELQWSPKRRLFWAIINGQSHDDIIRLIREIPYDTQ
jgi:hypothetical protein